MRSYSSFFFDRKWKTCIFLGFTPGYRMQSSLNVPLLLAFALNLSTLYSLGYTCCSLKLNLPFLWHSNLTLSEIFDPQTFTSWSCIFFKLIFLFFCWFFFFVMIALDIYSLKTISEWKCALEKSLNDAANFPLPMEVFKVKKRTFSFSYLDASKVMPLIYFHGNDKGCEEHSNTIW